MNTQETQTPLTVAKRETQQVLMNQTPSEFSAFGSITHFEQAQRMAKALSSSSIVPETYRGDQNLGSCIIALEMANRIGANVLSVMQNLYVVHGKPAWSSQFLISCVNASGRFTPLRYRMTGEKDKDSWGCIAWALDKTGEKLESPEITIAIAKAEGWFQKTGSKWKTMPELMLRYRTATLFARLYAPELTMGIHTDDEVGDVIDISPVVTEQRIKSPDFGTAPQLPPATSRRVKKDAPVASEPPPAVPDQNKPQPPANPELEKVQAGLLKHDIMEAQLLGFINTSAKVEGEPDYTELSAIPKDRLTRIAKVFDAEKSPTIDLMKAVNVEGITP